MKGFRVDRSIVFLLAILTILIGAVAILVFSMKVDPLKDSLANDKLLKVLIVLEDGGIPVSSNIVAYYPGSKRAAMFDIPGETGLIIRSLGRVDRIDSLYAERGIEDFRREIETLTGISVPFRISMTVDGFSRMTDLLGGLEVFIPTPVDLTEGDARVLLPSGGVTLDGDKLRTYISYSDPLDQEGERAARKQRAILAFFRALSDQSSLVFSKSVFPVVRSCVDANVPDSSLSPLLKELSQIDAERLVPQRVTGSLRNVDGKDMLFPFYDGQLLKDIVKQTLGGLASDGSAAQERVYSLEILNGTRSQGLAKNTSELYQSFGYDVIRVGNAEESELDKTVIIDRIGNTTVASSIAQVIQCDNMQTASVDASNPEDYGTEAIVDFTIILGRDFNGRYVR